ncbi:hypothetical protein C8R44DRAFT_671777 [Mycena epipterygia]|nr:hypothetical protein C8R44DRAFT_671777 [Mycena epipterygia]
MSATAPRRIVVDDTDPSIQYGPNGWYVADPTKLNALGNFGPIFNGSSHATTTSGSALSFNFNGTSISVLGTIAITTGANNVTDPTWACFIDEIPIENPQPTFQFPENNWLLCDQSKIAAGSHVLTIQVQSKGQPFYLDNILYTPLPGTIVDSAIVEYTNTDPSVSFGTGWQSLGGENVTQTAGAQVALNFHGTSVSLLGYIPNELSHTASAASYTIDGGPPIDFVLNGLATANAATEYNALLFTTNKLTAATHNLVVTYAGDSTKTPLVVSTFYVTNASTPSTTTSSPNTSASYDLSNTPVSHTTNTPIGAIVGGIVGCLAILALLVGLFFWCRRRRRNNEEQVRRRSANPFTTSVVDTVPASVSGVQYSYAAVPGSPAQPYVDSSTGATGPTYPYMHPASPFPPTDTTSSRGGSHAFVGSSSGGGSHAHNLSASYTDSVQDLAAWVPAVYPPTPGSSSSDGGTRSRKHEHELMASMALNAPMIAADAPLTPNRGNAQKPVVMMHHQDSGVRLPPAPSLLSEPEIVDLPPGYSRD